MKKINLKNFASSIISFSFVYVTIILLNSCARKMSFGNSEIMPTARGAVKIKTDRNSNNAIDIKVFHLAPADRLTPPKKVYVVWMVTANDETKNLGQLNSSSSMLSKTLKASLETTSPFKPVSFFITAEDESSTEYPSSTIVLNTK